MNSKTISLVLPAEKNKVFSYLSKIENLPKWATEFCQELQTVDGKHKVFTCMKEELFFQIHSDEKTGVIDAFAGPTEEQMTIFPMRVIEFPNRTCVVQFTMFQAPNISNERFEDEFESLKREFENIKKEFS